MEAGGTVGGVGGCVYGGGVGVGEEEGERRENGVGRG